jgi:hypothetical protein
MKFLKTINEKNFFFFFYLEIELRIDFKINNSS